MLTIQHKNFHPYSSGVVNTNTCEYIWIGFYSRWRLRKRFELCFLFFLLNSSMYNRVHLVFKQRTLCIGVFRLHSRDEHNIYRHYLYRLVWKIVRMENVVYFFDGNRMLKKIQQKNRIARMQCVKKQWKMQKNLFNGRFDYVNVFVWKILRVIILFVRTIKLQSVNQLDFWYGHTGNSNGNHHMKHFIGLAGDCIIGISEFCFFCGARNRFNRFKPQMSLGCTIAQTGRRTHYKNVCKSFPKIVIAVNGPFIGSLDKIHGSYLNTQSFHTNENYRKSLWSNFLKNGI